MINLGSVIRSLGVTPVAIERYPAPAWTDGIFAKGSPSLITATISVQPAGRNTLIMFDGVLAQDLIDFYSTDVEIIGATESIDGSPEGVTADVIRYNGERYEVQNVNAWESTGQGQYWSGNAKRLHSGAT